MRTILLVLLLSFGSVAADAAITVTISETATDVVVTYSGTVDLTGASALSGYGFGSEGAMITSATGDGIIFNPTGTSSSGDAYSLISGPATPFGTGSTAGTMTSGIDGVDELGLGFGGVGFATGTVTGDTISGGGIYTGASLASLGFTPGVYTWVWGTTADASATLTISAVPEPSSWLLAVCALGALAYRRRRLARD